MSRHLGCCVLVALAASYRAEGSGGDVSNVTSALQTAEYELQGGRNGQVTVKSRATGATLRSFQMQGGAIRELFVLDAGHTIGASVKDRTTFWDMRTGEIKHRIEARVYGFSNAGTRFFTHRANGVTLYAYPGFTAVCELVTGQILGPESFLFSPDDRFLAIIFASGMPSSDEYYPGPSPVYRAIRFTRLFDLRSCLEIEQFSRLRVTERGWFSDDSRYYDLPRALVYMDGHYVEGSWRFDLARKEGIKLRD